MTVLWQGFDGWALQRQLLSLDAEGFVLQRWALGMVPGRGLHTLLDWKLSGYEALEDDAPQGFCLTPPSGFGEQETDCFGSHQADTIAAVLREADALLQALREAAPKPGPPRMPAHPELLAALWVHGGALTAQGRLSAAPLQRPVRLGAVELPADSTVGFVTHAFVDPRRDDLPAHVTLAAAAALPHPGFTALSGAKLFFDTQARVMGASAVEPFTHLGVAAQGPLAWDAKGALSGFALGAPLTVGPLTLPQGTPLSHWVVDDAWYAVTRLTHPEAGPLHACLVSSDLRRLTAVSAEQDLPLPEGLLRAGYMPWRLRADGRIDLRACREAGLLR
jgi:hypothetical protein